MIRAAVWLASGRLHSWVSKAFSTRLPSGVFSNWKRRPHFEQCPEITMPLASLFTTYILGLLAMPTVSHSPETIASPVEIQTAPLPNGDVTTTRAEEPLTIVPYAHDLEAHSSV